MGRLFWKIFFGFWLSLVVIAVVVGFAVNLYNQTHWDERNELAAGPHVDLLPNAAAVALRHGGRVTVAELFQDMPRRFRRQVLIVDAQGKDLLGHSVPAATGQRGYRRFSARAGTATRAAGRWGPVPAVHAR